MSNRKTTKHQTMFAGLTDTQGEHLAKAASVLSASDKSRKNSREEAARELKLAGIGDPAKQEAVEKAFKLAYVAWALAPAGTDNLSAQMLADAEEGMALKGINSKAPADERKSQAQHDAENAARQALFGIRKLCGIEALAPKNVAPRTQNAADKDGKISTSTDKPASPECRSFPDVVQHCLSQAQAMDGMVRKAMSAGVPVTARFNTALAEFKKAMRLIDAELKVEAEDET